MPDYKIEVSYDMGMSRGRETHRFEADDDEAAKVYIKEHQGRDLSLIKRGAQFDRSTLCRMVK